MPAYGYEFYLLVVNSISHSFAALTREISSWPLEDKIHIHARACNILYISNKGEWNNCFSKFSNRVLPPIFISTILQSGKFLNLAKYFAYDVKLRLLAHSRSFSANQKARNEIVGAENLLKKDSFTLSLSRQHFGWITFITEQAL